MVEISQYEIQWFYHKRNQISNDEVKYHMTDCDKSHEKATDEMVEFTA